MVASPGPRHSNRRYRIAAGARPPPPVGAPTDCVTVLRLRVRHRRARA